MITLIKSLLWRDQRMAKAVYLPLALTHTHSLFPSCCCTWTGNKSSTQNGDLERTKGPGPGWGGVDPASERQMAHISVTGGSIRAWCCVHCDGASTCARPLFSAVPLSSMCLLAWPQADYSPTHPPELYCISWNMFYQPRFPSEKQLKLCLLGCLANLKRMLVKWRTISV